MSKDLWQFVEANDTLLILVLSMLAGLWMVQWRRIRVRELELPYLAELLAHGITREQTNSLFLRNTAKKSVVEQLDGLSGATKAGLFFVSLVTLGCALAGFCVACSLIGHSQFMSQIARQQAIQQQLFRQPANFPRRIEKSAPPTATTAQP